MFTYTFPIATWSKLALYMAEEDCLKTIWHIQESHCQRKTFVDRHRKGNEKLFEIDKVVLVFHTQIALMPRKLRFRWIGPYSFG